MLVCSLALSAQAMDANRSLASAYVIGNINSNTCPGDSEEVNGELECRDAAASVGGTYKYAGNWPGYPGGCYGNPLTSSVWMNNHPGSTNGIYAKVCRKDGAGDVSISMISDGLERSALLHIPSGTRGSIPLVINIHAWGSFAYGQELLSGMNPIADEEGFAVVYPRGYDVGQPVAAFQMPLPGGFGYSFNAGACCPKASSNHRNDVLFIRELLQHVVDLIPQTTRGGVEIDLSRVYVTGMSNGGFFTNRLACEARDLFAAVAPVAGVLINGESPTWGGDPFYCPEHNPPLPVIHFHGKADAAVPWGGSSLFGFPSIPTYIATRKGLNGIIDNDAGTVTYQHRSTTCTAYGPPEANFTFCEVDGGGHNWPGNPNMCGALIAAPFQCNYDIDASRQIWDFFKRYTLQASIVEV